MEQTQPTFTPVEMADNNKYASSGVGTAGMVTGITSLGLLTAQILTNLIGSRQGPPPPPPQEFVTQKESELIQQLAESKSKVAQLEAINVANAKTDAVRADLQTQILINKDKQFDVNLEQAKLNAKQEGLIIGLQAQLDQMRSCFCMMIPNSSVVPAPATASAGA